MTSYDLIPIKEFEQPSRPSWKFKPADASKFEASKPGEFRYKVESGNTPADIFNKARKLAQQNGEELTARSPQELLKENNIGKSFRAGQTIVIATRTKDKGSPTPQSSTQDTYVSSNPTPQPAPPKQAIPTPQPAAPTTLATSLTWETGADSRRMQAAKDIFAKLKDYSLLKDNVGFGDKTEWWNPLSPTLGEAIAEAIRAFDQSGKVDVDIKKLLGLIKRQLAPLNETIPAERLVKQALKTLLSASTAPAQPPRDSSPKVRAMEVAMQNARRRGGPTALPFDAFLGHLSNIYTPKRLQDPVIRAHFDRLVNEYLAKHFVDASDARDLLDRSVTMELKEPKDLKKLPKDKNNKYQANCHIYAKVTAMIYKAVGLKTHFYASVVSIGGHTQGHLNAVAYAGKFMIINNNGKIQSFDIRYNRDDAAANIKKMVIDLFRGKASVVAMYPEVKSLDSVKNTFAARVDVHLVKARLIDKINTFNQTRHRFLFLQNNSTEAYIQVVVNVYKQGGHPVAPGTTKFDLAKMFLSRWSQDLDKMSGMLDDVKAFSNGLTKKDFPLKLEVIEEDKPKSITFKNADELNKYIAEQERFIVNAKTVVNKHLETTASLEKRRAPSA